MNQPSPFQWRHFQAEIMLLCVRWYLRSPIPLPPTRRGAERTGTPRRSHDHLSLSFNTTPHNWIDDVGHLSRSRLTQGLVDETYLKVKGTWAYLYRAVDSHGNTLEFLLSATRAALSAKRFFTKTLGAVQTITPRVITVDKNPAYPKALRELQEEDTRLAQRTLRQVK